MTARKAQARVLLFHKPKGLTVTRADERGRRTVYDALPAWVREDGWVPVGRLDRETRGLLLFVREGALVERLTRPGSCAKVYEVWVRGRVTEAHRAQARAGVTSPAGLLKAAALEIAGTAGPKTRLRVTLDEGKNRHLRRLFAALKDPERGTPLKVTDLKRIAFGPLELDVGSGAWRMLTPREERGLLDAAGGDL
ncbi:MAG: pseudouridine synthase [Planctomycetota bacterium]|nr:pseudouridine synthase [Planctomycetota bacterium]